MENFKTTATGILTAIVGVCTGLLALLGGEAVDWNALIISLGFFTGGTGLVLSRDHDRY